MSWNTHSVGDWALALLTAYFVTGVGFAAWFHLRGIVRLDTAAKGAGLGFRLIISPGLVALWPLLWFRWVAASQAASTTEHQKAQESLTKLRLVHRRVWLGLLVLIPALFVIVLRSRPAERLPSQITPPSQPQR